MLRPALVHRSSATSTCTRAVVDRVTTAVNRAQLIVSSAPPRFSLTPPDGDEREGGELKMRSRCLDRKASLGAFNAKCDCSGARK
jgi:hypothetical protein